MKAVTLLLGLSFSIAAALPISDKGCQCTTACEIFLTYPIEAAQGIKFCGVDPAKCTDAMKLSNGAQHDSCAHLFDPDWLKEVTAWLKDTQQVQNLYNKIAQWTKDNIQQIDTAEVQKWLAEQINKIPSEKIKEFTNEQLEAINIDQLIAAGAAKLADLADSWDRFSDAQQDRIVAEWNNVVDLIPIEEIAEIQKSIRDKLAVDAAKLKKLNDKLKAIQLSDAANWAADKWSKVPIDNLAEMDWKVLQQVPVNEIAKWTQEKWNKLPVDKLVKLLPAQIAELSPSNIGDLTQEYWEKVPVYHVTEFSLQLLQSMSIDAVAKLNATNIAFLKGMQWQAVNINKIKALTAEQLKGINYSALAAWNQPMWDSVAVDINKVTELIGKQIEQIPTASVGAWTKEMWNKFPPSAAVMFKVEQLQQGVAKLKELTSEQLAKFDWAQFTEDQLNQLDPVLKEKIMQAKNDAEAALKKAYKELVEQHQAAKDKMNEAMLQHQTKQASTTATVAEKDAAEAAYNTASNEYTLIDDDLATKTTTLDGTLTVSARKPFLAMSAVAGVVTMLML